MKTEKELLQLVENKNWNNKGWSSLCINQKLTEKFMEKHLDKLDSYYICRHQKLTEKFMEKHSDKLDWCRVVNIKDKK